MSDVTLERHNGHPVAAKRAENRSRLSDEADLLSRLHHPGVVEFVSLTSGDSPALLTAWAGTDTWGRRPPTDVASAIHALAAIATTVDDLHSAGVAHRSLSPDHVIIANDGRPVLCGLGGAGPADQDGLDADRLGLQKLIERTAEGAESGDPNRLAELAKLLDDPEVHLRDFLRMTDSFDEAPSPPPFGARYRRIGYVMVVLGLAAIAAMAWPSSSHPSPTSSNPLALEMPPPPSPSTAVAPIPTAAASTVAIQTTDVVGHPQQLVIEHAGRRFGLGAEGDMVVVGDWNCDGEPTPAILQRSTGVVAVFNSWPEPGRQLTPDFTTMDLNAVLLVAESIDDCDLLRARGPYGSTIISQEDS